jgi:hypothetical protein
MSGLAPQVATPAKPTKRQKTSETPAPAVASPSRPARAGPAAEQTAEDQLRAATKRLWEIMESQPAPEAKEEAHRAWAKEQHAALSFAKRARDTSLFFETMGDFEIVPPPKELPKDCQIRADEQLTPQEVGERLQRFRAFLHRIHLPRTQGLGARKFHRHSEQLGNIMQNANAATSKYIANLATMEYNLAEPLFISKVAKITDKFAPCRKLEAMQLLDSTAKDFGERYKLAYEATVVDGEHLMASWILIKKMTPATALMTAVTADHRCLEAKTLAELVALIIKVEEQVGMLGLSHCGALSSGEEEVLESEGEAELGVPIEPEDEAELGGYADQFDSQDDDY